MGKTLHSAKIKEISSIYGDDNEEEEEDRRGRGRRRE